MVARQLNPGYCIDEHNADAIDELIRYFSRYQEGSLDKRKGILLMGPVGTGKTTIMKIFIEIVGRSYGGTELQLFNCFRLFQAVRDGKDKGDAIINRLKGKGVAEQNRKVGRIMEPVLDDIGMEPIVKDFGNDTHLSLEIIYDRYDLMEATGARTHGTTNLTTEELEDVLGTRAYDRMRAMFNLVLLDGPSRRK